MKEVILIKNGELALKGLNRRTFEDMLMANIRRRTAATSFSTMSPNSRPHVSLTLLKLSTSITNIAWDWRTSLFKKHRSTRC